MRILVICMLSMCVLSACSWVGQTAGKAQAKLERKADEVEKGYSEGYHREKEKEQAK